MWNIPWHWTLFLAFLGAAARCILSGSTPLRLGFAVICGLSWAVLSWRKARSIDRDRMDLPQRR